MPARHDVTASGPTPGPRRRPGRLRRIAAAARVQALGCALSLACAAGAVHAARCADDPAPPLPPLPGAGPTPAEPRAKLQALVRDALSRSQAVGAATLLAEAAQKDVEEARAAQDIQATVGGGVGPGGSRSAGITESAAAQLRGSVSVSKLVYDGGRSAQLGSWREHLAASARWGGLTQQEQIALATVTLALERSRHRMTTQVYGQSARKMACLVDALETIVRADRGRASELAQARKALQQAELAQSQGQSMVRQIEVRLRRFVGDTLPADDGLTAAFAVVPDLSQTVADAEKAPEIAQLDAQVAAAGRYAAAVEATTRPQLSLGASGNLATGRGGTRGTTHSGSYSVGVIFSVPLLAPGAAPATEAARKRAQAAQLQRDDELQQRRARAAEVHEQALASRDRARRIADVLRDSDLVRSATLQQWQQLGRRSLFDVMGAETEHHALRVAYVNALHDLQELNATLVSMGRGVAEYLR